MRQKPLGHKENCMCFICTGTAAKHKEECICFKCTGTLAKHKEGCSCFRCSGKAWNKGMAMNGKGRWELRPVYTVDLKTGCWNATRICFTTGYGKFWDVEKKKEIYSLHRYMYELVNGKIPPDLFLDHVCRNRRCINPDHLEPVTPAENIRRSARKLNHEKVMEIKKLKGKLSQTQIAKIFNVNPGHISRIHNQRRWA